MQTEKDRILELRKALEYHNYKYYIENAPEISDREFDGLMHDLEKLEEKYPVHKALPGKKSIRRCTIPIPRPNG